MMNTKIDGLRKIVEQTNRRNDMLGVPYAERLLRDINKEKGQDE